MSLIHFHNSKGQPFKPRNIKSVLDFINKKRYDGFPDYYIIEVKDEIMRYMTQHLFDKKSSDVVVDNSTNVSEEEFKELFGRLEENIKERNTIIAILVDTSKRIQELVKTDDVKSYMESYEAEGKAAGTRTDVAAIINRISELYFDLSENTTNTDGVEILIKKASSLFQSICRYILYLTYIAYVNGEIDNTGEWIEFWEGAPNPEDEDEFYQYLSDGGVDEDCDPKEELEHHRSEITRLNTLRTKLDTFHQGTNDERLKEEVRENIAVHGSEVIIEALKKISDGKEQKVKQIISNGIEDVNGRRGISVLTKRRLLFEILDKVPEEIYPTMRREFVDEIIAQVGDTEGHLSNLADLCDNIKILTDCYTRDIEKIRLLRQYNSENRNYRNSNTEYDSLKEYFEEKEVFEKANIPFFHTQQPLCDTPPDIEKIVYVPAVKRDFPTLTDMHILNEINNMIVCETTVTEGITTVDKRLVSHSTKQTSRRHYMVGFLYKPQYMIQVKHMGTMIRGEMFEDSEGSLPSKNKDNNIVDYLNHTTSVRERRRGHVYCIFYHNSEPHAADDKNIYPLNRVAGLLDFYTQEALLYIWDISKVNLSKNIDISDNVLTKSTHSEYTYLVVSVRRPDDLFYDKTTKIPYDVMILSTNILPRPPFSKEIMQLPAIKSKRYSVPGSDIPVTVEFNDTIWMYKFSKHPSLEIYDSITRSDIIYCSPSNYETDIVIGDSLNIHKVIERLRCHERNVIKYGQYQLQPERNITPLLNHINSIALNPFFNHYMRKTTDVRVGEMERNIVKQALRGIAYSLYCKLRSGFSDHALQDLTSVINSTSSVLQKFDFTRLVDTKVAKEKPGAEAIISREGYNLKCNVYRVDVNNGTVEYHMNELAPTRFLTIADDPDLIDSYYTILANFMVQYGSFTFTTAGIRSNDLDKHKGIINSIGDHVPGSLKAQIIGYINGNKSLRPDAKDVETFKNLYVTEQSKKDVKRSSKSVRPNIITSHGITYSTEGETELKIKDSIMGTEKVIKLPLTANTVVETRTKQFVDDALNEPFVGTIDMVFLTLLDYAMNQGSNELVNGLIKIYHYYGLTNFSLDELGTFLWNNLIKKELPDSTVQRIYFLISYQERNLILQSGKHIPIRDQYLQDNKPLVIIRHDLSFMRPVTEQ